VTQDTDYFYRRAEAELEMAERAENPTVVAAHCAIAEHYLEKCGAEIIEDARAATDGLKPVGG
jgi:hypothetical protein